MVQGTGVCCIALLPAIVATLAIGASILSTVWCEAIKFPPDLSNTPGFENLSEQTQDVLSNEEGFATLKFGLYYFSQVQDVQVNTATDTFVRVTDSCVYYDSGVNMDGMWKTARAFALIAPIAAGIMAIGLYVAPCCIFFNRGTWNKMAGFFIIIIPACQSLTLLFLASDACKNNPVIHDRIDQAVDILSQNAQTTTSSNTEAPVGNSTTTTEAPTSGTNAIGSDSTEEALRSIYESDCQWDWGMYANLLSMILFFVTGVIMVLMGPPTRPPPKEPEIQTVTYEQKQADGETPPGVVKGENVVVEEVDVQTETYNPNGPSWASTQAPMPNHQAQPY